MWEARYANMDRIYEYFICSKHGDVEITTEGKCKECDGEVQNMIVIAARTGSEADITMDRFSIKCNRVMMNQVRYLAAE